MIAACVGTGWLFGLIFVLSLCRAAHEGDEMMREARE